MDDYVYQVCDIVSSWQAACWRTDRGSEALLDLLSEQEGISIRLASMIKDMEFLSEVRLLCHPRFKNQPTIAREYASLTRYEWTVQIEVLKAQLAPPPMEAKPPSGGRLGPDRPYPGRSGLRSENTAPLPKSQNSVPEIAGRPSTLPLPRTRSMSLSASAIPPAETSTPRTADGSTTYIDPLLASMTLSGMPLGSWVFRTRPASKLPTLDPGESRKLLRMVRPAAAC